MLSACGAFDESPETLAAQANQEELTCNMGHTGKWGVYPEILIGTCGGMSPFLIFVDEQGSLFLEEEANCEIYNEIVIDRGPNNPCQKGTFINCINEELNLVVNMDFFLKYESYNVWEGNLNIKVGYLDEEEYLCESVYQVKVIHQPQEE
tara:strand:+ start:96 stop:545 length:450 start_codon:yes stop_codon:yes gene_type:complete